MFHVGHLWVWYAGQTFDGLQYIIKRLIVNIKSLCPFHMNISVCSLTVKYTLKFCWLDQL